MKQTLPAITALGFALFGANTAHAIPCQEVANMLSAGVPANIVASAIKDSGARYTASDISCLSKAGAPSVVLQVARRQSGYALLLPLFSEREWRLCSSGCVVQTASKVLG